MKKINLLGLLGAGLIYAASLGQVEAKPISTEQAIANFQKTQTEQRERFTKEHVSSKIGVSVTGNAWVKDDQYKVGSTNGVAAAKPISNKSLESKAKMIYPPKERESSKVRVFTPSSKEQYVDIDLTPKGINGSKPEGKPLVSARVVDPNIPYSKGDIPTPEKTQISPYVEDVTPNNVMVIKGKEREVYPTSLPNGKRFSFRGSKMSLAMIVPLAYIGQAFNYPITLAFSSGLTTLLAVTGMGGAIGLGLASRKQKIEDKPITLEDALANSVSSNMLSEVAPDSTYKVDASRFNGKDALRIDMLNYPDKISERSSYKPVAIKKTPEKVSIFSFKEQSLEKDLTRIYVVDGNAVAFDAICNRYRTVRTFEDGKIRLGAFVKNSVGNEIKELAEACHKIAYKSNTSKTEVTTLAA